MYQTYEAVIDETGKFTLLEEIPITKRCRALVIVLDEESKISSNEKTSPDENPNNDSN